MYSYTCQINLCHVLGYIDQYAGNIPIEYNTVELSKIIATNCVKTNLLQGHHSVTVAACSVMAAIKYMKLNIDMKTVYGAFKINRKKFGIIYAKIEPHLNTLVDNTLTNNFIKSDC